MAIYKDDKPTKDGRQWYYTVYKKDLNGNNKKHKSKRFKSKTEAKEAERLFLVKRDNSIHKLFKDIANEYFKNYENSRKYYSYDTILNAYENHIKDFFGNLYIDEITAIDIKHWKDEMFQKTYKRCDKITHYSYNYLNKCYCVLNSIYKYAMPLCGLNTNVVELIGCFERKNDEVIEDENKLRYITIENFNLFIEVIDADMWKTFFIFLMFTGMRKGETRALKWKNVNFTECIINVYENMDKKNRITNTKNKQNRKIKMNKRLIEQLLFYKNKMQQFSDFSEEWFIFGSFAPLSLNSIDRAKDKYFNLLNENKKGQEIQRITIHEFRHSHVSMLINEYIKKCNSLNIKIDTTKFFLMLSERMGHTIQVMQETYMHLFPTIQDEIVDLLDNL